MTAAAVEPLPVTEPGVYNLTDDEYFADPVAGGSLSSTGVRQLLPPSCPAKFDHARRHPRPTTKVFDVGHAAHTLVLGAGPELVRLPFDEWRTKAAKDLVAEVREWGGIPLKPAEYDAVQAMADAVVAHPTARKLLDRGQPERTLVWRDDQTGVVCRAKLDWLRADGIVDYKTCDRADAESLRRAVHAYGYHIQAAFYLRAFRALNSAEPFFVFVAQEKDPPYLVHTFQLTGAALAYGDRLCAEALRMYRDCCEAGVWPGYPIDEITDIDLPPWIRTEEYA